VSADFDLEAWWPEAFEGLTASERRNVIQACAANWHEGWAPNEPDVRNLTNMVRGSITGDEYMARARVIAQADLEALHVKDL
jgi:hypothetical protein